MYRPVSDPVEIEKLIKYQLDLMDEMDCPQVDMDGVISGDYGSLKEAMADCGIVLDPNVVDELVDQEKWHHR